MKLGSDFLGGAFFQEEAIKGSIKGDVFGILPETFKGPKKDGWIAVEAFAKSGVFSEGVVHLTPFDRSHKYPIEKLKPLIKKNLLKLKALQAKYPKTILLPSLFCEHTHSRKEMEPLFQHCRTLWAEAIFVNSIIGAGQSVPGTITEVHLESLNTLPPVPKGEFTVSFDGFGGNKKYPGDMTDKNIEAVLIKYKSARHIRAWKPRYNGKFDAIDDTTDVAHRKNWPTTEYCRGTRMCLKDREGKLTYNKKHLYKTFADDHGEGNSKNNLALVIVPNGGEKEATVFDSKGNKIDSMKRVTPDHALGRRYYSSKYACQIADKAIKNTGSALITIKSGAVTLPPTDGYLRSSF